jgi:hypothetical protein
MSIGVLENIMKVLNSLLLDEKISTATIMKTFEEANKLNVAMNYWCNVSTEQFTHNVCEKFNVIMNKLLDTSMKSVIIKVINNEIALERDILGEITMLFNKILETFKYIILRSIIIYDNKILCKVKKPFYRSYHIVLPGYVMLMTIDEAVRLASLDYVDIIDAL